MIHEKEPSLHILDLALLGGAHESSIHNKDIMMASSLSWNDYPLFLSFSFFSFFFFCVVEVATTLVVVSLNT
jgi:hypothetical protein